MIRFGVYLMGLVLVIAAVWVLLTQTGLSQIIPAGILIFALLLLLGFGLMGGAARIDEHPIAGREVVETRQQVGDTEVRRSKLE